MTVWRTPHRTRYVSTHVRTRRDHYNRRAKPRPRRWNGTGYTRRGPDPDPQIH